MVGGGFAVERLSPPSRKVVTMKFAYTRLVTADVRRLAGFYEQLLGVPPKGGDDYVELHPQGAIVAIVSRKAAEFMHGGIWPAGENRSAILEFEVEDVDAERARIDALVTDWLQQPKDMPWGNRSVLFRDPDGNPINLFKPRVVTP
jgi:predicted enzyme related to lactoylglutathione lyase